MSLSGSTSVYLPLPQSNTDSDSEEELHSGRENHSNHVKSRAVPITEIRSDPVEVAPQSKVGSGFSRLSRPRKAAFLLSLLICLLTIAGFLWLLPCDVSPCPPPPLLSTSTSKSWETPLPGLEVHGAVGVAAGNVVVLARRAWVGQGGQGGLPHEVVCLLGGSGDVSWSHMLAREPLDLDCGLLDANRDGVQDCLIAGRQGLLKAIDPLSGLSVWEVEGVKEGPRPVRTLLPLLLPDVTSDGVPDLLTARSYSRKSRLSPQLVLLSGATGKMIGTPEPCPLCADVTGLLLDKLWSLSYTCIDNANEKSEQTIPLTELLKMAGKPLPPSWRWEGVPLPQEGGGEARVGGARLLLENQGHCPAHCRNVLVIRDHANHTLYNHSLLSAYGVAVVPLSFEQVTGFIVKLWQWRPHHHDFERVSTDKNNTAVWVPLSERVVLITFNVTHMTQQNVTHVVNVSEQSVTQLCRDSDVCQPSASDSAHSLVMADLDGDGWQELVSYSSSYVISPSTNSRYLLAKIRKVRLQAELPLLYSPP